MYTIEVLSKILVPWDQIYFPRRSLSGNQNLANSLNNALELFYHTETNINILDVEVDESN